MKTMCVTLAAAALVAGGAIGIASAQSDYLMLRSFQPDEGDCMSPWGDLVSDGARLYGTAYEGCAAGKGAVFSVGKDGGGYTLLHVFSGGPADGEYPRGTLVYHGGVLYGSTGSGGAHGDGTIFSIHPDGSSYRILHSFSNAVDGDGGADGVLTPDGDKLYGVTGIAGPGGGGTIFAIDTDGTDFTLLHSFVHFTDEGYDPVGGLALRNGTLYGMTERGGKSDKGAVFAIRTNGSNFGVIHSFIGGADDGEAPRGKIIEADGTLYGMTSAGGSADRGTVFSMGTAGSFFTVLHQFAGGSGDYVFSPPRGSLAFHDGVLYGMTPEGGARGEGTLFALNADGTGFTVLHDFFVGTPEGGAIPFGGPMIEDGVIYGTTYHGGWLMGAGRYGGAVFEYSLERNYVGLAGFPGAFDAGERAPLAWECDFSRWDYRGAPVDIYLAAIRAPRVANGPSSVADALAGGEVFLAVNGAREWRRFEGTVEAPTWSAVLFPAASTSGSITIPTPADPALAAEYVFATVFARSDGSGFVRTDGMPVENSNVFVIR